MYYSIDLFSINNNEIKKFLDNFYEKNILLENDLHWNKEFKNPIDMIDMIGAFIDNIDNYKIAMWISLDKDVLININKTNANNIIKYIFERYPY